MKIRKVLDKKIGKTSYYKYIMRVPNKIVEKGKFLKKDIKVRLVGEKILIENNNNVKRLSSAQKTFRKELLKISKQNFENVKLN
jgi:hypothetical protein